jgi:hypothetical protein
MGELTYRNVQQDKTKKIDSQTSGGAPRSRAGGACEAPPQKNEIG